MRNTAIFQHPQPTVPMRFYLLAMVIALPLSAQATPPAAPVVPKVHFLVVDAATKQPLPRADIRYGFGHIVAADSAGRAELVLTPEIRGKQVFRVRCASQKSAMGAVLDSVTFTVREKTDTTITMAVNRGVCRG